MQWGGAHSSYRHGLGPNIRAAMSVYNDMIGLENFMQKVTCISQRLLACQPNKAARQLASPTVSLPVPESMRLDSIRLTRAKRALPHCGRTLPLLCSCWSLHPELSRQTPTPCGEYPPTRARHFHVIFVISTTTHPWSLCCNLCPGWLWLLGQFYIQDLLSRLHLPEDTMPRSSESKPFREICWGMGE